MNMQQVILHFGYLKMLQLWIDEQEWEIRSYELQVLACA